MMIQVLFFALIIAEVRIDEKLKEKFNKIR
jgi:hypothetical protein